MKTAYRQLLYFRIIWNELVEKVLGNDGSSTTWLRSWLLQNGVQGLYNSVNNVLHSEQSVPETGHPLICPSHWYMCVIRESLFLRRWARYCVLYKILWYHVYVARRSSPTCYRVFLRSITWSSDIVVSCTQCWDLWATEVAFVLRVAFTRYNLLNFTYFPVSCLPHAVQNTLFDISFNKGEQFATTLAICEARIDVTNTLICEERAIIFVLDCLCNYYFAWKSWYAWVNIVNNGAKYMQYIIKTGLWSFWHHKTMIVLY